MNGLVDWPAVVNTLDYNFTEMIRECINKYVSEKMCLSLVFVVTIEY